MEEKIVLDKETFKALAVDTRLNILKMLNSKSYTLSDISELLGMSNSTVKEHLDVLCNAGLIKKEETDRKWKYYSITFKGKRLIEPREVKVLFAFAVTVLSAIGLAIAFIRNFHIVERPEQMALRAPMAIETEALAVADSAAIAGTAISWYNPSVIILIAFIVLVSLSTFFLGMLLKKPAIIISKNRGEKK